MRRVNKPLALFGLEDFAIDALYNKRTAFTGACPRIWNPEIKKLLWRQAFEEIHTDNNKSQWG